MSIILSARVMSGTAAAARPTWSSPLGIAMASLLVFGALVCRPQPALAQFSQQGPDLVGSGNVGKSGQGSRVAISADGNTAIVGGNGDNSFVGAAWIYTRSGSTWSQQGAKLVGAGAVGLGWQGWAVAISADGNTALVGGYQDNGGIGAAWVYTRNSSGGWSQQGPKLVGSGYSGLSGQAVSVALSADGNTALLGAWSDNGYVGAAWVFTRSGTTWSQQGPKLIGSGYSGTEPEQGYSVALSADGNTALIGGPYDNPSNNSGVGAAWVFTRSGTTWSQQETKLVGSNPTGNSNQGWSVALSADGNTALIGGPFDNPVNNSGVGAAWVFTRNGTSWSQQGTKLIGSGAVGAAQQGVSAALSATGNIAIIGGPTDNSSTGAAWIFTRSPGGWTQSGSKLTGTTSQNSLAGQSVAISAAGTTAIMGAQGLASSAVGQAWVFAAPNFNPTATHDFNGDGTSDILWRDGSGDTTAWFLNNGNVTSGTGLGNVPAAWSVVASRDFDSNGSSDMLWRDTSGDTTMWLMSGGSIAQGTNIGNIPTAWSVVGGGDFNGDGKGDILWHDTSGDTTVWFMNGGTITGSTGLGTVPTIWSVAGTGDFNGDGTSDILWHDIYGDVSVWEMSGGSIKQGVSLGNVATNWSIVGTGDFNSDGTSDVLWRDTAGDVMIWLISNGTVSQQSVLANVATTWSVAETGDFNGDGYSDILWIDTSGNLMIWYMNGLNVTGVTNLGNVGTVWTVQGSNAD